GRNPHSRSLAGEVESYADVRDDRRVVHLHAAGSAAGSFAGSAGFDCARDGETAVRSRAQAFAQGRGGVRRGAREGGGRRRRVCQARGFLLSRTSALSVERTEGESRNIFALNNLN